MHASRRRATEELKGIEQSLVVNTEEGLVVIVGCSHPGVRNIFNAASNFGRVYALIGGLHGFREFDLLKDLKLICPCHCTQFKSKIERLYQKSAQRVEQVKYWSYSSRLTHST